MTDLSLSIAIKAVDNVSNVFKNIAGSIGGNFGNAAKDIKFAMQNIGTEGTLAQDALVSAGGNMGMALAGVAVAATAVSAVIGTKAVQAAGDFQASMIKSQAEAGLTKQQMTDMGNAILDMAPKVGQAPKALADGLFFVESAGFAGKDALTALRLSAEMAANDMSDTSTVAKGLTAAVKAFGLQTSDSAFVANQMTVTVSSGKMTMSDYANVIGKTAQMAHNFHVGMSETNAALDTLSNNGFPSAATAGTALQNVLQQFDGNTAKVAKNVRALGGSFDESKFKSMDLQHQVRYLSQAMKGHEDQLQHVLGGSKSAALGYNALKTGAEEYTKDLQKLNAAQQNGGAEAQSFAATQQGFNFQMQQAKAAVDVLMIKLGSALLPVLSQLMSQITPLITKFTDWAVKNHVLENMANALGAALGGLIGFVSGLINVISTVVGFFQHNEVAMNALKAVLITVGILIMAIVVPAFIMWAISAASAAISTIILFAPLIALIAIISLVVFGIIEAIQHWGQIVAWLKGVWGAVSSWFMSMLGALGAFFAGIWNGILSGIKVAWNAIVNAVKVGAALLLGAILAPFHAVGALFVWLYNHNTYVKKLVDAIVNLFKACLAWVVAQWQGFVAWLGMLWQGLVGLATTAWNNVVNAVKAAWSLVVGVVTSVWQSVSNAFSSAWNTYIAGPLRTLWNNVSSVFSSAWNTYIAGPLGSIWNNVSKWFAQLGTGAANSGKSFISMLVSGITSGAGAIWNAVTGIAKNIWKALGFHSPAEEGPGADADKWMPNLVSMLSSGLIAGVPKIQAAVNVVSKPLAALGTPAAAGAASPVAAPAGALPPGAPVFYITITAPALSKREGQTLADEMMKHIDQKLRGSGNHVTWTSGGKR